MKLALRSLLRTPGFTAIAILTLAFGIGLNTSMFSLMNLLLFPPLPFAEKDQLVRIYRTTPQSQIADHTAHDYLDLAGEIGSFADVGAVREGSFTLAWDDRPPVNLQILRVSGNFFSLIRMQPELGRIFSADDDRPGNQVIILSHRTWQSRFGADPAVIGRTVRVDGEPSTIIGVMPAAFASPFLWGPGEAFQPLALTDADKLNHNDAGLRIVARSRLPSLAQLNTRLVSLTSRRAPHRTPAQRDDGLRAVTLQSSIRNPATVGISSVMLGLAGFVLLIACANLANLQLARAVARSHEFAIRAALGASRARLLRPLLCESLVLSLAGGLLGVLLAAWANDWISSWLSAYGVVALKLVIDWRVLSFSLAVSAFTGVAFGLVPAWLMSRIRAHETLKSGGRGYTSDRAHHRSRHGLIIAQFSLALVLLIGAGAFAGALHRMLARDAGWDHRSMLQGMLNLPAAKYSTPEKTYTFYTQLQDSLRALPGVEEVAVGWTLPTFHFLSTRSYLVEGRAPPPAGREPRAFVNGVTPTFLDTLKMKLIAGRNFTDADHLHSRPVAIINESMARTLFPDDSPIGRRIGAVDAAGQGWMEIVGVVADVGFAINAVERTTRFLVMRPLAQETWRSVTVALRSSTPEMLTEPMRQAIARIDPDLAVKQLNTVEKSIELGMTGMNLMKILVIVFATLGLFLAAIGLYGVIANLVAQRTREIGVRVALGAQSRDVVWLIVRSGLGLTLWGTVIGLAAALGLLRLLSHATTGLSMVDPVPIASVTLLLMSIALLACWLPARRAARVNPVDALRAE